MNTEGWKIASAVVQGLADGAVILDEHFRPLSYNYAWSLLTGLRRRELERQLSQDVSVFDVLDGQGLPLKNAALLALREGKEIRLDAVPIQNALGETRHVLASLIPLQDASSRFCGLLQILRDISAEVGVQEKYKDMLALEKVRADQLEREVEARTKDLRAALEQVTLMSRTDPLTGLLNRRAFTDLAEQAFKLAERHQRQLALILCDLDFFKKTNDAHGHQAGDVVLVQSAKALKQAVRGSDAVARFGGEEFIILLSETDETHVMEVARRCTERVRDMPLQSFLPQLTKPQTVSVGVAIYPQHGTSLDVLTQAADKALYQAKAQGRNRVVVFHPSLPEPTAPLTQPVPKVLLAATDGQLMQAMQQSLTLPLDVMTCQSVSQGLDVAVQNQVQVLVVDVALEASRGLDLMYSSLTALPDALRILLVDSKEQFHDLRQGGHWVIDAFLLRSEAASHLGKTIEEAVSQRKGGSASQGRLPAVRVAQETLSRLDAVISERKLSLMYQPMFEVASRKVTAFEVLSRAEEATLANPEVLFDVAVASGRIWKLSRLVRQKSAEALRAKPAPTHMLFLNLHPAEIDDPHLLDDDVLRPWAQRICFEITERASLPDLRHLKKRMRQLRDLGYRFAVDDLGAGYASLNALALLEPDFVKIDRLTVQMLVHSRPLRTLARRIVEFADEAGIKVIGEGVERESELRVLQDIGCHWVQGYYVSHPRPDFHSDVPFFG